MASKNIRDIADEPGCPICHQAFKDPVILQLCGHHFCRACLQGQWRDTEGRDKTCPVCKESLPADMSALLKLEEKGKEEENKEMVRQMMTAPEDLSDQLTCSLCSNTFQDPVFLKTCGHNFCHKCILMRSTSSDHREIECPTCKLKCPSDGYAFNTILGNMLERRHHPVSEEEGQEERHASDPGRKCEAHQERITLFCLNGGTLCCLVCRDSLQHQNHTFIPLSEASDLIKGSLFRNIQKQLGILNDVRKAQSVQEQKITEHKDHKQQISDYITEEYEKLHKSLTAAQEEHRQLLDATYDPILTEMERNTENLLQKQKDLENNLEECQKKLVAGEIETLQDIAEFIPRYCNTGQIEDVTVINEKPPEGLFKGPTQYYAWRDMLSVVQPAASPLTLDPDTANRSLLISADFTGASYKPSFFRRVANSPKRFSCLDLALTSEGFTNGRHYWEVDINGKKDWDIGLMKETLDRKESSGIFVLDDIWGMSYNIHLGLYSLNEMITILGIYESPNRLGVYLDYEGGQISFYDVPKKTHLCSFSATFTGKLYPYIGTSTNEDAQMNMVHIRL